MQAFWFGVIAVLWAGFFMLEGFDFGVGMLLPIVAGNETERKVALRSIGPVWDGNEVWLLVAGGATFAAFPEWYASVFSGFYLAFMLLLIGLILRGIGLEYRGKAHTQTGRNWCDFAIIAGSILPALLLGVAFANFIRGVKLNSAHEMTGGFFELLSPYALLGGVFTLLLFAYHGALFLSLRTTGEVHDVARATARPLLIPVVVVAAAFVVWSTAIRGTALSFIVGAVIVVAVIASGAVINQGREGLAFLLNSVATALIPIWTFTSIWPNVLPARNVAAFSLTVHNASSTPYTLRVMTVVALIFTPLVLVYQAWSYWVFRARVTGADVAGDGYGGGGVNAAVGGVVAKARQSARTTLGLGADGSAEESGHDTAGDGRDGGVGPALPAQP
ncbi:cytochrome d ubiquinol oxidase subunit II [Frankineae bacterium MT45]|nr:cytochrome d ubiquinol oxidase subunit II [Frankineae bacterium MT45]